jgi:predicted NBD/HSP70 family sugar kinase
MRSYTKVDKSKIARMNKYNVFGCIVREGPINRAAIAKRTDLSVPTVMAITGELLEKDAIRSIGKAESGAGKPPEMLEAEPGFFYILGVDVGRTAIRVVINDAVSEQKCCYEESTGDPFPEDDFIFRLAELIKKQVKSHRIGKTAILGAGIAMPGLIESGTGRVIISPDFGWKDIPLQEKLQRALPFPTLVKNSNHALALNESAFEDGGNYRATFCVNLGYGIGAALVIDGELYAGAGGTSGELGHSVVEKGGPLCKCGNAGCLESVASGEAIARQAAAIVAHHRRSKIAELCGGDILKIDARLVFTAAEEGDRAALKILNAAADYIGIGLSTAVNVLDPDRVILCGGLMRNGDFFLEHIRSSMEDHVMPHSGRNLELTVGKGGEYSTAQGACRVLLNIFWTEQMLPI